MSIHTGSRAQAGFSLLELMIVLAVMLVLSASVFALMKNSIMISATTYEMTDAQESLRTAQEYINRDLLVAGDGLKSFGNICVRTNFVTNFLTRTGVNISCGNNMVNLPLIQSDNNVPAGTAVLLSNPATTVRSVNSAGQTALTDRINIIQADSSFGVAVTLLANISINATGQTVVVPAADINKFNVGEIYFFSSSVGGTFGVITAKNTGTRTLTFASGDAYGLNNVANNGPIALISDNGELTTTIRRMRIINYFVNNNGLLIRRVFGVGGGAGFTDNIIAEHITGLQFRYILNLPDATGFYVQPVPQLANEEQQAAVSEIEVTVTSETVHPLANGTRQEMTMTATTGVRSFQFPETMQ
jgi:prepilin-type N-terminal cleavage/methylation domain-containing protein